MTSVGTQISKLSHKAFRALLKKFRRKKKRCAIAVARDHLLQLEQEKREKSPNFKARAEEQRRYDELWEEYQEREKTRKHKEWLHRDAVSMAEFQKKKKMQEEERIKREELRKQMLAEIEELNMLDKKTEDEKKKKKNRKEEVLQTTLAHLPQGNEPWHNPIAPDNYNIATSEKEQCHFFAKTGCCRFGDRCSRGHVYPEVSTTVLIRGMYSHFSIDQSNRDDYDTDMGLEFEDNEMYQDFGNFYKDVLPEFKKFGKVVQFKVCKNHESHLRGNVYVQYTRSEHAVEAFKKFNGRYYAGKQLSCEFTHVINWKSAICGMHITKRCPKGNNCNFLHVFQNPGHEFWEAENVWKNPSDRGRLSSRSKHGDSHRSSRRESYSPEFRSRHSYYSPKRNERCQRSTSNDRPSVASNGSRSSHRSKRRHSSTPDSDSPQNMSPKHKKHKKKHKKSKKKKRISSDKQSE